MELNHKIIAEELRKELRKVGLALSFLARAVIVAGAAAAVEAALEVVHNPGLADAKAALDRAKLAGGAP